MAKLSTDLAHTAKKGAGIVLIGVGGLDLAFGNTNTPMLPAPLANLLTQNVDVVLIGIGIILLFL